MQTHTHTHEIGKVRKHPQLIYDNPNPAHEYTREKAAQLETIVSFISVSWCGYHWHRAEKHLDVRRLFSFTLFRAEFDLYAFFLCYCCCCRWWPSENSRMSIWTPKFCLDLSSNRIIYFCNNKCVRARATGTHTYHLHVYIIYERGFCFPIRLFVVAALIVVRSSFPSLNVHHQLSDNPVISQWRMSLHTYPPDAIFTFNVCVGYVEIIIGQKPNSDDNQNRNTKIT